VTILNERTCLDTNVFILGLRKVHPPSVELLTYLDRVNLIVPARVLNELAANLTSDEMREFFDLFEADAPVLFDWTPPPRDRAAVYAALGCRRGDSRVAAGVAMLGGTLLVSNNRHFLSGIPGLPFRVLSPEAALAEAMLV
jgi:predicted nucleic acid-binding protein